VLQRRPTPTIAEADAIISIAGPTVFICNECDASLTQQPGAGMVAERIGVAHVALQVSINRCLETSIILKIDAPRAVAEVRNPARRLWAPKSAAFSPSLPACFLTISQTDFADTRRSMRWSPLRIDRKTGPSEIPAASSHSRTAVTGRARKPLQTATTAPYPLGRSCCA